MSGLDAPWAAALPAAIRAAMYEKDGEYYMEQDGDETWGRPDITGEGVAGITRNGKVLYGSAAARCVTEMVMRLRVLPFLPNVLDGVYRADAAAGTVALSGLAATGVRARPVVFMDFRDHVGFREAFDHGLAVLADLVVNRLLGDAWRRVGSSALDWEGPGAAGTLTAPAGTLTVVPVPENGVALAISDGVGPMLLGPGETVPDTVIEALGGMPARPGRGKDRRSE